MIRNLTLAALGLLVVPVCAQAQEAYALKIKRPGQGDTLLVEKADRSLQQVKVSDLKDNVLNDKEEREAHAAVYRETILEKKPGARAARLKRSYTRADRTVDGVTKALSYQGKTVLVEQKDGKYAFRIEGGGELSGADAVLLDREFNRKKLDANEFVQFFLPARPVKAGEAWQPDRALVNKGFQDGTGFEVLSEKTVATGKLTRVYQKDGRLFGVVALHLEITPKSLPQGDKRLAIQPESRVVIDVTLDGCLDGSAAVISGTVASVVNAISLRPSPEQPMARVDVTVRSESTYRAAEP